MNQSRRLFINIIATHLRSFYALAVGLLTGRWMLMALGHEAYGLFGLVGGLIVFVTIFNTAFSGAIMRYFAVSIGNAANGDGEAKEDCCHWFSVAVCMLTIMPVAILVIGYPIGAWMVRSFLTIPSERIEDCMWVFRLSCLSCLIGLINVPFRAMYVAKQNIAELTMYSVVQTTAHLFVLMYFVRHEGDWLVPMAVWWCVQQSIPNCIQMIRALIVFKECRLRLSYCLDFVRMRKLATFTWWQLLGMIGDVFRVQGSGILINKYLGAVYNATGTLSTTIAGHSQAFANEVDAVFAPAIATAYGANDRGLAESLVMRCDKYSTLLIMAIVIPLSLEMEYIVSWWLKAPPPAIAPLTTCLCAMMVLNKLTSGHVAAINASGRIKTLQLCAFACRTGIVIMTWLGFSFGGNILWYGGVSVLLMSCLLLFNVLVAKKVVEVPIRKWGLRVLLPVLIVAGLAILVGGCVRTVFPSSFLRVIIVAGCCLFTMLGALWGVGLDQDEKAFVLTKVISFWGDVKRKLG